MSIAETILKGIFTLMSTDSDVDVKVDNRGLGMAYGIPSGTEQSAVNDYGPWSDASIKQVFYRQSALGSTLAEVQLILSWQCSSAQQYIINANLDKNVLTLDPTVNLGITVRFDQPELYDSELEAYRIRFTVEIKFNPLLGMETEVSQGYIQADGSGVFPVFPAPTP